MDLNGFQTEKNIMKMKNMLMLTAAFGVLAIVGCSEKEEYDFDGVTGIRIYVDKTMADISVSNILKTPVGIVGGLDVTLNLKSTSPVPDRVTAHIEYDADLVGKYNKANGTEYRTLPPEALTVGQTELAFEPESVSSDTVSITFNTAEVSQLEDGASYLIPVTLSEVSGTDVRLARDEKFRVRYYVLKYMETSSLINDSAAEVPGSALDASSFTCIKAENIDPAHYTDMFAGGWSAAWNFSETRISSASFILDFGRAVNVAAFNITCYVMSDAFVEISGDGVSWVELGRTSEHSFVYDSDWNRMYVLYAGISARYMKAELTLDPSAWAWQYADYGYAGITGINVYAE